MDISGRKKHRLVKRPPRLLLTTLTHVSVGGKKILWAANSIIKWFPYWQVEIRGFIVRGSIMWAWRRKGILVHCETERLVHTMRKLRFVWYTVDFTLLRTQLNCAVEHKREAIYRNGWRSRLFRDFSINAFALRDHWCFYIQRYRCG